MKRAVERSIMQYNISGFRDQLPFQTQKEKENVMKPFFTADITGSTLELIILKPRPCNCQAVSVPISFCSARLLTCNHLQRTGSGSKKLHQ